MANNFGGRKKDPVWNKIDIIKACRSIMNFVIKQLKVQNLFDRL
jgi:hypothetical protein